MTDLDMSGFVNRVDKAPECTLEQRRSAIRYVAGSAFDTEDCEMLLESLGLTAEDGR